LTVLPVFFWAAIFIGQSRATALKNITVGKEIPPFVLPGLDRAPVNIEAFRGSPTAIIFWSTWSPRSAEILEDFRAYFQEYSEKGLRIVAVNIDGEKLGKKRKKAILDYAAERDIPFPILLDEDLEAFSSFGVMAHPSLVIVDQEGTVTYQLGGYSRTRRWEAKDELLKVLGLYEEPARPEDFPAAGYIPKEGALQHYRLGMKMMEVEQWDKALASFSRAAERDPGYIEPLIMSTRVSLILGELEEAEAGMKAISSDYINRADVRFMLGYLMLLKEKDTAAETIFKGARAKSPGEGWGTWGLGLVYLFREDVSAALNEMETAVTLQPENPEAEAYVRRFAKNVYLRGRTPEEEERLLALFPFLKNLKERYRMMMGGSPAE